MYTRKVSITSLWKQELNRAETMHNPELAERKPRGGLSPTQRIQAAKEAVSRRDSLLQGRAQFVIPYQLVSPGIIYTDNIIPTKLVIIRNTPHTRAHTHITTF